jgi:hypothetical protein
MQALYHLSQVLRVLLTLPGLASNLWSSCLEGELGLQLCTAKPGLANSYRADFPPLLHVGITWGVSKTSAQAYCPGILFFGNVGD